MSKRVLFAGESWFIYITHTKGFDSFYESKYESAEGFLKSALEAGGIEVDYMPNHVAAEEFPYEMEELKEFDAVILSDIGANTLLLPSAVFNRSERKPNRCDLIRDYVLDGGALLMIGGYMTFSGIDAKGKWQDTAVQEVLPVQVLDRDDRMEHGEGIYPVTVKGDHEILEGIESDWPHILGYNKTVLKDDADLLVKVGEDPFIAVGEYGKGRSAAFTTDCAPHWAPPEFCDWSSYDLLFQNIVNWLTK
ncbi:MAG: cytoplasmic protein [Clostridiaceae bacterium]|nr:cytoplasmic protein [Clostridiaceae bacterium]